MDEKIGVRIPKAWKKHLEDVAEKRMPGTNICDLVREAIYQVYFQQPETNGNGKKKAA